MKKKLDKKKILLICFTIIVIVATALSTMNKNMQNDTFYTIKVGEAIEKFGVDMKDHFSFIPNLRYTYPHWLYDLAVFKIYNSFGFDGLLIGSICLSITLASAMFLTLKKITKNYGISLLILIFSFPFLKTFMTVRAQTVSYLFLLLILFCLEMIRERGEKKYILFTGILSVLIASTHAAVYPIIFILFLPILASDLLYKLFKNKKINEMLVIEEAKNTKLILITLLVCILCGFLSPGLNTYLYSILIMLGDSTLYITEHFPTSIKNNPLILIHLGIIVFILLNKKIKINIRDFFMIGGLFLLELFSLRNFSLFTVLSIYSFGRIFSEIEKAYFKKISFTDAFNTNVAKIVLLLIVIPRAFTTIASEINIDYINYSKGVIYPTEMVDYIKDNLDYENMRIYHHYDYGAYLLFKDIKVFIDSRSDLYMKEFNKGVNAFDDAMGMPFNYKEVFEKYDFTHLLLSKDDYTNVIIELLPEYRLIKEDDNFKLYEKINNDKE